MITQVIPKDWMPDAKMSRVICHWTAGASRAGPVDKEHYHILVEGDGKLIRGDHTIAQNERPIKGDYAAHTLNCNGGSIGVSLCCMAGATEKPFDAGHHPMTKVQWDKMIIVVAELCLRYKIGVTPQTVLSHAEVQGTLGIQQRGKWDFTRLAFAPLVLGAAMCGKKLRDEVTAQIAKV